MVIIEAFSIAASLLSFVLALLHLWKGFPCGKLERRTQVIVFSMIAILLASVVLYLGSRYKQNLQITVTQSDYIHGVGLHEVYYPVPYCTKPYLKIKQILLGGGGIAHDNGMGFTADGRVPFKLLDQSRYGFKLELIEKQAEYEGYKIGLEWKAEGKVGGCEN